MPCFTYWFRDHDGIHVIHQTVNNWLFDLSTYFFLHLKKMLYSFYQMLIYTHHSFDFIKCNERNSGIGKKTTTKNTNKKYALLYCCLHVFINVTSSQMHILDNSTLFRSFSPLDCFLQFWKHCENKFSYHFIMRTNLRDAPQGRKKLI